MASNSGPTWKSRFNQKQLERKRLADRISQRRARRQSREAAAELEQSLSLLQDGDLKGLLQRTIAENNALRAKLNKFQTKLESIHLTVKDYLEDDSDSIDSTPKLDRRLSAQRNPRNRVGNRENTPFSSRRPLPGSELNGYPPISEGLLSVFFQTARMMNKPEDTKFELSTNEFLESFMAWKQTKRYDVPYEFPIDQFILAVDIDRDELYNLTSSRYFYENLVDDLVGRHTNRYLGRTDNEPQSDRIIISESMRRRREVAYIVYKTLQLLRSYMCSVVEFTALFWNTYKAFLFFMFPTVENLTNFPLWNHPTPSQLMHEHPSYIDLMIWPRLREYLATTWDKYNVIDLVLALITGIKIEVPDVGSVQQMIRVKDDGSDLELSESFASIVTNAHSWRMQTSFFSQYPELAPYVSFETTDSVFADLYLQFGSNYYYSVPRCGLSFDEALLGSLKARELLRHEQRSIRPSNPPEDDRSQEERSFFSIFDETADRGASLQPQLHFAQQNMGYISTGNVPPEPSAIDSYILSLNTGLPNSGFNNTISTIPAENGITPADGSGYGRSAQWNPGVELEEW
ncbi:hypothetical protein B7463_g11104, partial [Scytalidium lignicola]